jgi:hypothetical protein
MKREKQNILLLLILIVDIKTIAQNNLSTIQTSNKKIEQAFNWEVDMDLSHVQTSKSGVVDHW